MKAVVSTRYGPPEVLQLREVLTPVPRKRDLLIEIHAAPVTVSDCYIRSGVPTASLRMRLMLHLVFGMSKPRRPIPGSVLAGRIVKTGTAVSRFHVGDGVFAFTFLRLGACAQYASVPESSVVTLAPSNLTFDEAAALPYGGVLALHVVRKAGIRRGQHVLIYGASGEDAFE